MNQKSSPLETIAAISTALGPGGINIVRMSGPESVRIAEELVMLNDGVKLSDIESHRLVYARVIDPEMNIELDEALVSVMKAPGSYTREDVVEINCHGGARPAADILEALLKCGARLAEPGEFTKRAFLHGRIDLAQAEAVADIIKARTSAGLRSAVSQLSGRLSERIKAIREQMLVLQANLEVAVDWPEEELTTMDDDEIRHTLEDVLSQLDDLTNETRRTVVLHEGITAAIIGRPNVGKSSLLNMLAGHDRAIVTAHPGTTRDVVEAMVNVGGYPVVLRDTAGIRDARNEVERLGIEKSHKAIEQAALSIMVVDGTMPLTTEDAGIAEGLDSPRTIVVINKKDKDQLVSLSQIQALLPGAEAVALSSLTGDGLDKLEAVLEKKIAASTIEEHLGTTASSARHFQAMRSARSSMTAALEAITEGQPEEIISLLVAEAYVELGMIIGESISTDLLDKIFENFCIGK